MIQSYVKTFFWSSAPGFPKTFYMERWKPDGTSTVLSASDPTDLVNVNILFEEAKDFQIKGDFMFATKQSKEVSFNTSICTKFINLKNLLIGTRLSQ